MSDHSGGEGSVIQTPPLPYPDRRSIRLTGYDYAQEGFYFVTVCTYGRECLLGSVVNGEMRLNQMGQIVNEEWKKSQTIRKEITLDAFVVMPNHVHAILAIHRRRGEAVPRPLHMDRVVDRATHRVAPTCQSGSLGAVIGQIKSICTKRINELRITPRWPVWQRNYYEHIIRRENDFWRIREYIRTNPEQWDTDNENPVFWL